MIILLAPCGSSVKRFHLNGHTIEFCPQTQKLGLHKTNSVM